MNTTTRTACATATLALAVVLGTAGSALAMSRPSGPHEPTRRAPTSLGDQDASVFSTTATCASGPTYTVPDGVVALRVVAVGAAGGSGRESSNQVAGGSGGVVTTTMPVRPGQQLKVQVGGPGGTGTGGGTGGVGGGADGGASQAPHNVLGQPTGQSGGGGGFSGVAAPDCTTWYAVAGGGGGAGGGATGLKNGPKDLAGGRGGDGCPLSGASCTSAAAGSNTGGWTGAGNPGAAAPSAAGGGGGNTGAGPSGHVGGKGAGYAASSDPSGGGGGGGGGYWAGGGGGSGKSVGGGGGGGAGGTSWTAGFSGTTYAVASAGQQASVTITPLSGTDVVIQSSDNGQVLNIYNGSTDDGTPLIQFPRSGTWNEVWNLVSASGGYQIRNPQSGKCAAVGGPNVGDYSGVVLKACGDGAEEVWTVDWQADGTARIVNAGQDLSIAGSATAVPVDVAPPVDDTSHRWSIVATGWPHG